VELLIYNEIGLEQEIWLLDKYNKILEPSLYGFPSDEMGFLIEIRSEHSDNVDDIVRSIRTLKLINANKARKLGFHVVIEPYMDVDNEFIDYFSTKYKYNELPDFTRNVYGESKVTHHTGIIGNKATAGLHVHFSRRVIDGNKCKLVKLPTEEIVKNMDNRFREYIIKSDRLLGEYELKQHGFEYRSLPDIAPLIPVTKYALEILENIK